MEVKKNTVVLRLLIWFVAILLFHSSRLWGQEGEGSARYGFKGFVDTYHAVRSSSPFDFMSSRTRVRGELERSFGNSKVAVSVNATYNALLKDETGLRLREAFFEHQEEHWGLRLGRQIVIWGAADGVRITDLISPMDMTEFLAQDYDDIRMPVNALRFSVFNESMKVEVVVLPVFEGYRLPVDPRNPWNIFSLSPIAQGMNIVWKEEAGKPAFKVANIEYGARWSTTLSGIDFALAALHTWNKMPVIEVQGIAPTEIIVSPRYYRMGFVGGDLSVPVGQFVFRGEAAFNIDKHFTYKSHAEQEGFQTINWLAGADWYAPGEWMISGQFSMESVFRYRDFISQRQHSALITLNVSKKFFGSTLQLSDFTYYDLTGKGWFSRFAADYALNDQIHLMAGYDWFSSKGSGIFDRYKDNSELWFKARYSF